jgi:hypothetical protein
MKKRILISLVILFPIIDWNHAYATSKPFIESFKFSPDEIDLATANTTVTFELVVSHPNGIEENSATVTLSNIKGDNLSTLVKRTDSPVNYSQTKVTFKGSLVVPLGVPSGVYNISVSELHNINSTGYRYTSGMITLGQVRNLIGAETGLLIRNNGDLNLQYDTFVGPTHDRTLQVSYNNTSVYSAANSPIFRVGEIYSPLKYYELRIPSLPLVISTESPLVCISDGKEMKFIGEGNCSYRVSTPKTKDYAAKISTQNVYISPARSKPILHVGTISQQSSKTLPLKIPLTWVYGPANGYVMPKSETPKVCLAVDFFVNIISGGTCVITYQSEENSSYLASDLYRITFEIVREPQTITFTLPSTANVSTRSIALEATTSSGGAITYSTTSAGICSITGSTLNLLKNGNCTVTATQAGTSTLAPASETATLVLTDAVVSNRNTITGANPKCPKGFKFRR